jgi:hypothetical protein
LVVVFVVVFESTSPRKLLKSMELLNKFDEASLLVMASTGLARMQIYLLGPIIILLPMEDSLQKLLANAP